MRKFNFEDESNIDILEFQKLINIMLVNNYTIDKIALLLEISKFNIDKIIKYKFKLPEMKYEQKFYYPESVSNIKTEEYTYDNLSTIEQAIYNNLK